MATPVIEVQQGGMTDYPHVEGGKESKRKLYEQLTPLGDDVVGKFFVTNGELLLPA